MTAPRIAVRAGGVLARFNAEGVLAAADVHVARRLGALTGESDERVLLAVALLVRAVRGGSVCLFLDDRAAMLLPEGEDAPARTESVPTIGPEGPATERVTEPATDLATGLETGMGLPEPGEWLAALAVSPLLASGAVRLVEGRLYLERYWRDETIVRAQIDARLTAGPSDDVDRLRLQAAVRRLFPGEGDDPQRQAATLAARHRLCIVTGGPGTGKTTTVARLVALLQAVAGPGLRVALAAPTGKAAARLAEAVQAEVARMDDADRDRVGPLPAGTVHRLLGWKPGSRSRFAHDRHRHLPYDVVVVDETSMVSLPLMARLLEAIPPTARVVLVGDPDQLASVDAGAVLGDLVAHPRAGALAVVRLEKVHRHGSAIGDLARAVRAGSADDALAMLRAGGGQVSFVEPVAEWLSAQEITAIRGDAVAAGTGVLDAARRGDAAAALAALGEHRVLLAHRRGPFGVTTWAGRVEAWVRAADEAGSPPGHHRSAARAGPWYPGRPLLVTTNDRESGLFNGDTGVVIRDLATGAVVAAFGDAQAPLLVRPHRLPTVETVHAMTVHRAQGSQFRRVSIILPPARSPLLTRELLYTALTRAQSHVRIVGTEAAVRSAIARPVRRASGLRFP